MLQKFKGLTGAEIIKEKLIEYGITTIHAFSGGAIMPLIDQFHVSKNKKINYYIHSHEQNCGHASTGYAKSSGKMGVSIVTSGPGLTNMITPILDSTNDSTPLMVISGQVNQNVMGTLAFQECPAIEITKSITKFNHCLQNVEEIPFIMDKAYSIANSGKKGTVHIDLPKSVATSIYNDETINHTKNSIPKFKKPKYQTTDNNNYMKEIANIINQSKKPIFYIGQGCNGNSTILTDLVNKSNIFVTTTIHALGIVDYENPLCLKWLGMHGYAPANFAIQESDCIICIGARFDDRTTGEIEKYAPEAKLAGKEKRGGIIHVNIEESEINKNVNVHYPVLDSAENFIKKITPLLSCNNYMNQTEIEWYIKIQYLINRYPFYYEEPKDNTIKMQSVISEINNKLKNINTKTIITTGVGTHQMQTAQFIDWNPNIQFISSGSLGVMGVGIPYGIGAKIANPDKNVIVIDGDSSSLMTISDLKTIKEYNIPIKIAILNNSTQGMVEIWEELFFDGRITATKNNNNPSFSKLAESFGIKSLECSTKNNLSEIVSEFLNHKGPILCEFKVNNEICLPLVKPGCALDDMVLYDDYHKKYNLTLNGEVPC